MALLREQELEKGMRHLAASDPVLAALIKKHGPFTPLPHTDYYRELVQAIISQQLSVKAAATIEKRFVDLFGGGFPSPVQIIEKDIDTMRTAGLSRAKAAYIQDLAHHIKNGTLQIDRIATLENEELIKGLVAVKGIGEWTAHMFLIFAVGRLDVLPVGDLGVRSGIKQLYGFETLPSPDEIKALAAKNQWSPYESMASWYIWKHLDNTPQ